MPRQALVVAAGAQHHITQRGNNRRDVLLFDEDRGRYAERVRFSWRVTRSCLDRPAVIAIGDEVNRVVGRELLALAWRADQAVAPAAQSP